MKVLWFPLFLHIFGFLIIANYCTGTDDLCFQVTSSDCLATLNSHNKCAKISNDASASQMYCCNITSEKEITDYITKLKSSGRPTSILGFHLRDSNISRLSVNVFNDLPELASLSITENIINKFEGSFERHSALTCLNISRNTQLADIPPHLIVKLKSLRNFDMSHNRIQIVPDLPPSVSSLFKLDVSENKHLPCRYLINLTLQMDDKTIALAFVNKNSTYCLPPNAKVLDSVIYIKMQNLEKVKVIFQDCPKIRDNVKCECSIYSLDYSDASNENTPYMYQALVNCSNKQMTSLPKALPPNTRVLDISNNSITSFEGIGNETYSTVRELYADNNKITSFKHLEGTSFLDNFHNLTLRNNKIDQIQGYLLSNVFDRNYGKTLLLAKNELKCDCQAASHTKLWLTANKAHIPDYDQIFAICEPPVRVLDLDPKDLCSKPTNWKDYIRYLIVLEVTLFVLLIGKVSYDYYVFKTAGYLPWPASKMPKLPCDWCFET